MQPERPNDMTEWIPLVTLKPERFWVLDQHVNSLAGSELPFEQFCTEKANSDRPTSVYVCTLIFDGYPGYHCRRPTYARPRGQVLAPTAAGEALGSARIRREDPYIPSRH